MKQREKEVESQSEIVLCTLYTLGDCVLYNGNSVYKRSSRILGHAIKEKMKTICTIFVMTVSIVIIAVANCTAEVQSNETTQAKVKSEEKVEENASVGDGSSGGGGDGGTNYETGISGGGNVVLTSMSSSITQELALVSSLAFPVLCFN